MMRSAAAQGFLQGDGTGEEAVGQGRPVDHHDQRGGGHGRVVQVHGQPDAGVHGHHGGHEHPGQLGPPQHQREAELDGQGGRRPGGRAPRSATNRANGLGSGWPSLEAHSSGRCRWPPRPGRRAAAWPGRRRSRPRGPPPWPSAPASRTPAPGGHRALAGVERPGRPGPRRQQRDQAEQQQHVVVDDLAQTGGHRRPGRAASQARGRVTWVSSPTVASTAAPRASAWSTATYLGRRHGVEQPQERDRPEQRRRLGGQLRVGPAGQPGRQQPAQPDPQRGQPPRVPGREQPPLGPAQRRLSRRHRRSWGGR